MPSAPYRPLYDTRRVSDCVQNPAYRFDESPRLTDMGAHMGNVWDCSEGTDALIDVYNFYGGKHNSNPGKFRYLRRCEHPILVCQN